MFRPAAAMLLLFSVAWPLEADTSWVLPAGQSGDWSVGTNWSNGVPTASTVAGIVNGGTATITSSWRSVGAWPWHQPWQWNDRNDERRPICSVRRCRPQFRVTGTFNLSGGQLTITNWESVGGSYGDYGVGAFNHTGGTNTTPDASVPTFRASGTYSLSGTGQLNVGRVTLGYSGPGNFFQTGGNNTLPISRSAITRPPLASTP